MNTKRTDAKTITLSEDQMETIYSNIIPGEEGFPLYVRVPEDGNGLLGASEVGEERFWASVKGTYLELRVDQFDEDPEFLVELLPEDINDWKEDEWFNVTGFVPNTDGMEWSDECEASAQVYQIGTHSLWYIKGSYDMGHSIEGLGEPVLVVAEPVSGGNYPPKVMEAVQNILFLGLECHIENNGLTVEQSDINKVFAYWNPDGRA